MQENTLELMAAYQSANRHLSVDAIAEQVLTSSDPAMQAAIAISCTTVDLRTLLSEDDSDYAHCPKKSVVELTDNFETAASMSAEEILFTLRSITALRAHMDKVEKISETLKQRCISLPLDEQKNVMYALEFREIERKIIAERLDSGERKISRQVWKVG